MYIIPPIVYYTVLYTAEYIGIHVVSLCHITTPALNITLNDEYLANVLWPVHCTYSLYCVLCHVFVSTIGMFKAFPVGVTLIYCTATSLLRPCNMQMLRFSPNSKVVPITCTAKCFTPESFSETKAHEMGGTMYGTHVP